jgi:hypothetical protein
MAKDHRGTHHLLTRTTPRLEGTIQKKVLPAIRPICHHQSIRHSKSLREELSYKMAKEGEDEAMTLAVEMSRHDMKLSEMANLGKGNKKVMTMTRVAAAKNVRITHPAATITKGKAPTAMTRTQVHLNKEAAVAAEMSRRMLKVKRSVTYPHPHHHQEAPMAAVVVAADRHAPEAPNTTCHKKVMTCAPDRTKLPSLRHHSSSALSALVRKFVMSPSHMGSISKRIFASTMGLIDR